MNCQDLVRPTIGRVICNLHVMQLKYHMRDKQCFRINHLFFHLGINILFSSCYPRNAIDFKIKKTINFAAYLHTIQTTQTDLFRLLNVLHRFCYKTKSFPYPIKPFQDSIQMTHNKNVYHFLVALSLDLSYMRKTEICVARIINFSNHDQLQQLLTPTFIYLF